MPKVSIIVPVYNSSRYLPQCLESVLLQSFKDYEVLLVDDGSTDGSGSICDEFAKKDERFHVFHKDNGGVSSARNLGLDAATGEWITFLDSDDLLPEDSIDNLLRLTGESIDMSIGSLRKFDDNMANIETVPVGCIGVISVTDCIDRFIAPMKRTGDWQRYIVNRLFKASIINSFKLRFPTDLYYKEDGVFLIDYLARCSGSIACIDDVVYLYRQVKDSAMGSLDYSFNDRLFTNIDAHGEIYRTIRRLDVPRSIIKREENHLFDNYYWIRGIMKNAKAASLQYRLSLNARLIKSGGLLKYIEYIFILRFCRVFKKD